MILHLMEYERRVTGGWTVGKTVGERYVAHPRNALDRTICVKHSRTVCQELRTECLTVSILSLITGCYPVTPFSKWEKIEASNHCQHHLFYPHQAQRSHAKDWAV